METATSYSRPTRSKRPEEATGEERDRLFRAQAERSAPFAEYQEKTDRVIPVIVLTPSG